MHSQTTAKLDESLDNGSSNTLDLSQKNNGKSDDGTHELVETTITNITDPISTLLVDRDNLASTTRVELFPRSVNVLPWSLMFTSILPLLFYDSQLHPYPCTFLEKIETLCFFGKILEKRRR